MSFEKHVGDIAERFSHYSGALEPEALSEMEEAVTELVDEARGKGEGTLWHLQHVHASSQSVMTVPCLKRSDLEAPTSACYRVCLDGLG